MKKLFLLFRSLPPLFTSLYFLSVVLMNILAGKELVNLPYLVLDCGYLLSWLPFLFMDMMCKHYGPKAAAEVAIAALIVNLLCCILFKLVALAPGHWSAYYAAGEEYSLVVDSSLNSSIAGTWYILMGSFVAMFLASITNSAVFSFLTRFTNTDGFGSFAIRSYISTAVGQFVDNMTFTSIVSHVIFGWSWNQVLICASLATIIELIFEIIFSPISYKFCILWRRHGIGKPYLDSCKISQ